MYLWETIVSRAVSFGGAATRAIARCMVDAFQPLPDDPVFGPVSSDELAHLFDGAQRQDARAGELLLETGNTSERALFLYSGLVRTSWPLSTHRSLLRGLHGAPGLLVDGLSPGSPVGHTINALTDCVVLSVAGRRFADWLTDHARVALQLAAQSMSMERLFLERFRQQQRVLPERLTDLLRSYLAAYRHAGHADDVELPLTNEVIASDLGVVARSVSSALAGLQKDRIVRRTARGLVVLRLQALAGEASFFLPAGGSMQRAAPVGNAKRFGSLHRVGEEAQSYPIDEELRIGRAPECRVRLFSDDVALRQCRVFRATTSDRFWIEDLRGSGNVLLNGRSVTRAVLSSGDTIRIGTHELIFTESVSPTAS